MGMYQSRHLSGGWESAKKSNPALWERVKQRVISENVAGTLKGKWSARKAQLAVQRYKEAGGKYIGKKSPNNSLVKWGKEEWKTKSGMPSHITGERYLPKRAIENLTDEEYQRTSKLKRQAMKRGQQFSKQPIDIANKVKQYR